MSNGKEFQSDGAATLKVRKVEDNFVRGTTSKCPQTDRNDLVDIYIIHQQCNQDVDVYKNDELNKSIVRP